MRAFDDHRWTIVAPIALLAAVLGAAVWLDVTTGGDAAPPPLLGKLGTPVRGTYVAPTPSPVGFEPTRAPRATVVPNTAAGTAEERDARRRSDILVLIDGLQRIHEEEGAFPSTGGGIQSLCIFPADQGCTLEEVIGAAPPSDPLGDPNENGYWYQSDGKNAKIYISFEGDIPDEQRCVTDYAAFQDHPNLICPAIPIL